jgi:hypothetical protein
MSLSIYQASVPAFERTLVNLKAILEKAAAHASERKIEESALITARLFPDMLPLSKQIQIAADFARGTAARLAGVEMPKVEDTETTFAELITRIDQTLDYVKSLPAAKFEGSETREISRPIGGKPMTFTGADYLVKFALPNFYFHATTAYAILRHNGIALGKLDYLGSFS